MPTYEFAKEPFSQVVIRNEFLQLNATLSERFICILFQDPVGLMHCFCSFFVFFLYNKTPKRENLIVVRDVFYGKSFLVCGKIIKFLCVSFSFLSLFLRFSKNSLHCPVNCCVLFQCVALTSSRVVVFVLPCNTIGDLLHIFSLEGLEMICTNLKKMSRRSIVCLVKEFR